MTSRVVIDYATHVHAAEGKDAAVIEYSDKRSLVSFTRDQRVKY